jgi:hypothetical protein
MLLDKAGCVLASSRAIRRFTSSHPIDLCYLCCLWRVSEGVNESAAVLGIAKIDVCGTALVLSGV